MPGTRIVPGSEARWLSLSFVELRPGLLAAGASPVFREVSGRTVMDYIDQFLVLEATFLLKTTSLSISQIADRLHFYDIASFSKFFSRMTGVSPRKYRGN